MGQYFKLRVPGSAKTILTELAAYGHTRERIVKGISFGKRCLSAPKEEGWWERNAQIGVEMRCCLP